MAEQELNPNAAYVPAPPPPLNNDESATIRDKILELLARPTQPKVDTSGIEKAQVEADRLQTQYQDLIAKVQTPAEQRVKEFITQSLGPEATSLPAYRDAKYKRDYGGGKGTVALSFLADALRGLRGQGTLAEANQTAAQHDYETALKEAGIAAQTEKGQQVQTIGLLSNQRGTLAQQIALQKADLQAQVQQRAQDGANKFKALQYALAHSSEMGKELQKQFEDQITVWKVKYGKEGALSQDQIVVRGLIDDWGLDPASAVATAEQMKAHAASLGKSGPNQGSQTTVTNTLDPTTGNITGSTSERRVLPGASAPPASDLVQRIMNGQGPSQDSRGVVNDLIRRVMPGQRAPTPQAQPIPGPGASAPAPVNPNALLAQVQPALDFDPSKVLNDMPKTILGNSTTAKGATGPYQTAYANKLAQENLFTEILSAGTSPISATDTRVQAGKFIGPLVGNQFMQAARGLFGEVTPAEALAKSEFKLIQFSTARGALQGQGRVTQQEIGIAAQTKPQEAYQYANGLRLAAANVLQAEVKRLNAIPGQYPRLTRGLTAEDQNKLNGEISRITAVMRDATQGIPTPGAPNEPGKGFNLDKPQDPVKLKAAARAAMPRPIAVILSQPKWEEPKSGSSRVLGTR